MIMKCLVVIFAMTTVICGIGWICRKISVLMLWVYMLKKGYKPPNDKEIEACKKYVVDHIVEDFFKLFKAEIKDSKW